MIRTNKKITIPIEDTSNELVFEMTILSRSKLDKWSYTNLIVAIGVRLDITNSSSDDFEIIEIGLAIKQAVGNVAIYSAEKLKTKLPFNLNSQSQTSIFFEGHSFLKVLSLYKDEEAVFFAKCNSPSGQRTFKSKEFVGDGVESKLENLKQGELANWAQEDFVEIGAEAIF